MPILQRLTAFFGLHRSIVGLLSMVILVGMGERMGERFLPKYVMALGGGALAVGVLGGLKNLIAALYSFFGGYVSARLGTKRALLVFNLISILGFLIVILIPSWPAVIAGSFFFLSWSATSLPATMSLVAQVLPKDKRTMGVTMQSLVRRFPMAVGPLLGGYFIDRWGVTYGERLAFAAAVGMAVLAIILQQRLIEDDSRGQNADAKRPEKNPFKMLGRMSPALRRLLVADILVRFCEQIPDAFVVIWCTERIAAEVTAQTSGLQFGALTTIEMATAVLCYIPVAYLADRSGKKPFVVMTFVFFSLFPLALMFCRSFWMLVPAFVLRGLKEFGEPTRKALILDLAPDDAKAAMFGVYYLARDSIVSIAALGGAFLWVVRPEVNFVAAFLFGIAGTIWFAWRGHDLTQESAGE